MSFSLMIATIIDLHKCKLNLSNYLNIVYGANVLGYISIYT